MCAEKSIPNIYFLYGQQNSGKTLTAQFLGKKYKTGYFVAQPKESAYTWEGYTDQKVLVLENDMYKERYFEVELLIMYPYYNKIRNVNLKPEVLLILSREAPDAEMKRILQTYKGSINMLQPKVFTDTFDGVLNRVSNLYNLKDAVAEFKKERKELEEKRLQEEKRRKLEEEAKRKAEMKKPVIKLIETMDKDKRQPEQTLKGMKVLIQVSIKAYTKLAETIKENQFLRFFVSSSDSENAYVFAVFRKSVEHANICGEIYHKVYSSYWENIEWIWKKGTFLENYRFGGYDDLKSCKVTAREVLEMPDNDAMDTLTLEEYSLYRTLKKINN